MPFWRAVKLTISSFIPVTVYVTVMPSVTLFGSTVIQIGSIVLSVNYRAFADPQTKAIAKRSEFLSLDINNYQ